jgi:protein ImuB
MVVWCPDWPVMGAMAEHPAGSAVAVFGSANGQGGMVLACNPAARADGVRRGMRRRDAQSRCPGLVVADHRPGAGARGLEAVWLGIEELSPGVARRRPGLCALWVPEKF